MHRLMIGGVAGLTCLAFLVSTASAKAMMIAPAPIPERVAQAEVIVIGTVGKVEPQNVSAIPFPGAKDKVEYQVVALKIDDALMGAKAGSEIRVGFIPPQNPTPAGPGVIRTPLRRPGVILTTGQEACFFLTKHPEENFYVAPAYFDIMEKKVDGFDKDMALVKRCVKLLSDPDASLKSKEAEDRLLTAGMLVSRYRTAKPGSTGKTEAIDAEQSKRILEILADADWNVQAAPRPGPVGFQMTAQTIFFRLGLIPEDGWVQPQNFMQVPAAAKAWLKEHAGTYRIKRFVVEKSDKDKSDKEKKD
ncbi:MAG TPA: hypothetical protein VG013_10915 [Gemmataceae bacterium]|nr:hypothetical protein [Gemmataceae bacterium]